MSTIKRCDIEDCMNDAFFYVAVYNEDSERLDDHVDVCGADHAQQAIKEWLKELADIEEAAAGTG